MYLFGGEILARLEHRIRWNQVCLPEKMTLTIPKLPSPNFSMTLNRCLENSSNENLESAPQSYKSSLESTGNLRGVNLPNAKCCSPDSSCTVQDRHRRRFNEVASSKYNEKIADDSRLYSARRGNHAQNILEFAAQWVSVFHPNHFNH